jgi:hypothetical protein
LKGHLPLPHEILYRLSYLSSVTDVPFFEPKDGFLKNYILGLFSILLCPRKNGLLAQAPLLDFLVYPHQPGDYMLMKTWKKISLSQIGKDLSWSC